MCCTTPGSWLYASSMRKLLSAIAWATVGRPDGRTVNAATRTRLRLFKLRPHVLFVAVRTVAVTELRLGSLFDIALDRLPFFRRIADAFAVGANRQQALELLHVLPQAEDPLGGLEPGAQLVHVDRLRDEVVGARLHAFEVPLFSARRGDQEEVGIAIGGPRAQATAQLGAINFRHLPVG